ncbi:MAG: hypothetical protein LQ342_001081 [Letrouitia transgressa]|nr:MAG: hypothetical protein LQ342_001081 [Letrouitia transgressa]
MELDPSQTHANPIIAPNKLELVRTIKSWITKHKGTKPPACVKWDQKAFENCFAKEATCTNSSSLVWILRVGILDKYMSWIVEYENGSCQLARQVYNRRTGFVYQPWLGGDRGFATQPIVCLPKVSGTLRIQSYADQRGLDAEDVLNDYAVTEFDLASDQDQEHDLIQLGRSYSLPSALSSPFTSSSDSDYGPQNKRIQRPAQVKLCRKRGMVNKSRKVRTQADTSANLQMAQTTIIKNEDHYDQFMPTPRISDQGQGPKTSNVTGQVYTDTTFNASGSHTLGAALFSPPDAAKSVRFHFFVANESLGAIMKTMDLHATRNEFFNQVVKANQFGTKTKICGRVIAASVGIEGYARPIVVLRQSEEAFTDMMEVVRELASASITGRLDVEVRCMRV